MESLIPWPIPRTHKIVALNLVIEARSRHRKQRSAAYLFSLFFSNFFYLSLCLFLVFLARKFALILSIKARSQTAWATGLPILLFFWT